MPRIITYRPTKSPKRRASAGKPSLLGHLASRIVHYGRLRSADQVAAPVEHTAVQEANVATAADASAKVWDRLVPAVKRDRA